MPIISQEFQRDIVDYCDKCFEKMQDYGIPVLLDTHLPRMVMNSIEEYRKDEDEIKMARRMAWNLVRKLVSNKLLIFTINLNMGSYSIIFIDKVYMDWQKNCASGNGYSKILYMDSLTRGGQFMIDSKPSRDQLVEDMLDAYFGSDLVSDSDKKDA